VGINIPLKKSRSIDKIFDKLEENDYLVQLYNILNIECQKTLNDELRLIIRDSLIIKFLVSLNHQSPMWSMKDFNT
jgi:hypothetical protein